MSRRWHCKALRSAPGLEVGLNGWALLFLRVFKHGVKTSPQRREEGQLFGVRESLWEWGLNWAWEEERLWPGGRGKAKSNEQLRGESGVAGRGLRIQVGGRVEDGCLGTLRGVWVPGTLRGETSHSSPPWTVAQPFPTQRLCPLARPQGQDLQGTHFKGSQEA